MTKTFLRALSVGVDRLNDGDPKDRQDADAVIQEMAILGYVFSGTSFVRRDQLLVTAHLHENGYCRDVFTDEERAKILSFLGVLPENTDLFNLPDIVSCVLANLIRDARVTKKLRAEPEDLR